MQNIAGWPDCDEVIVRELYAAGISQHDVPRVGGSVPYTVIGKLEGLTFKRDATCWRVTGEVPMKVALRLYDHAGLREDIRCGMTAQHPTEAACLSELAFGEMFDSLDGPTGNVERIAFDKEREVVRAAIAAQDWDKLVIKTYFITSELGLRMMTDVYRCWAQDDY